MRTRNPEGAILAVFLSQNLTARRVGGTGLRVEWPVSDAAHHQAVLLHHRHAAVPPVEDQACDVLPRHVGQLLAEDVFQSYEPATHHLLVYAGERSDGSNLFIMVLSELSHSPCVTRPEISGVQLVISEQTIVQ